MMKSFLLFGLFLLLGFKSPNENDISIIVHFQQILNKYRCSNGLNELIIDESIKEFTDLRSKNLIHDYSHNQFYKNIYSYNYNFKFAGENIAMVRNLPNNQKPYYSSNIKEIGDIMNKMAVGESTNYDIAMYCFLLWKHSPSHNKLLLNSKIKRFYLSYDKDKTLYYFCFIALG